MPKNLQIRPADEKNCPPLLYRVQEKNGQLCQLKCDDDEVPLVWFVILGVADERLHLVVDAARLACVARSRLQGDACRAMRGKLEVEWMRILAQLLDETLLQNISIPHVTETISSTDFRTRNWRFRNTLTHLFSKEIIFIALLSTCLETSKTSQSKPFLY